MTQLSNVAATELAATYATQWGNLTAPPELIRNRENIVFRLRFRDRPDAAMRLHRPGYQTQQTIEAELIWTAQLADQGFPCPRPMPTRDDSIVTMMEGAPLCSVVTWIDASPIGENGVAFRGGRDALFETYRRVGALIRRLHDLTDTCDTRDLSRPHWNKVGFLGDAPLWGRFWENPSLTEKEAEFLIEIRENAAQHFEVLNAQFSLIHADLLQENILQNDAGLHIIDFDDAGFGPRLYDLGSALIQHAELPEFSDLVQTISEGYSDATATEQTLHYVTMLRSMASAGWTISRFAPNDPRHRFYVDRMLRCAAQWSGETAPA